jgi:hypothetical protein
VSPGDEDFQQSVTVVSEGSQWSLSNPASTPLSMSLRGNSGGAPIQARIQVLASQVDTF